MTSSIEMGHYDYANVRGYMNRGKVKRMVKDGWEIVNVTPIILGGMTLRQAYYFMRKAKAQ
jgi:hypothetical protein